jgi:antirestriction protein ArdC
MLDQKQIRNKLSDIILEALKAGAPPWRSIYNRGTPTNPKTGQKFTGINPLVLDAIADKNKYRSKYWATYKQWLNLGVQVPRRPESTGESDFYGIPVVNWKPFVKVGVKGSGELAHVDVDRFNLLQTYTVFNAEQCGENLIFENKSKDYLQAETIVNSLEIEIREHESIESPVYDRSSKIIFIPLRVNFLNDAQYWATKFHEIFHWVEGRIGWSGTTDQSELIAEIATGYLESELNLPHDTDTANHDKWMSTWIEKIENNPKYLFEAAAQASRSLDYLFRLTKEKQNF